MKRFRELIEERLNEDSYGYPADDMTMKEVKVACYAAQKILDMMESGAMVQRWQISAIVKAAEELTSVYTSMSADEEEFNSYDDEEEWDGEEEPMYVGFEYPSMYESTELDEISMEKIQKVRDRAAKRVALSIGKTEKNPETGLNRYIPATDDEMALAKKGMKSFIATGRAITRKVAANKRNEEAEQIDEISKSTLGSYATKALNRADIAARMSTSDSDEMGKIANKRTAGVKKAVDRLAGKRTATSIKSNIDKAREAARNRGTDKDDEGKAYYAAQKGISKVREEVELDEVSKDTLKSYRDKATAQLDKDWEDTKKGRPGLSNRVVSKRVSGVERAYQKLKKEEVEINEAKLERGKNTVGAHHLERDSGDHKMYTAYTGSLVRRLHTVTDKDDNILGQGSSAASAMAKAKLKKPHRDALMHDDNQIIKVHDTRATQNVGTQVATPGKGKWFKDHDEAIKYAKSLPGKIRLADPKTGHVD